MPKITITTEVVDFIFTQQNCDFDIDFLNLYFTARVWTDDEEIQEVGKSLSVEARAYMRKLMDSRKVAAGDEVVKPSRGWTVEEVSGAVRSIVQGEGRQKNCARHIGGVIKRPTLQVGEEIACPTISGYEAATVRQGEVGLYAESNGAIYNLAFDRDRDCWVSHGGINAKALEHLKAHQGES